MLDRLIQVAPLVTIARRLRIELLVAAPEETFPLRRRAGGRDQGLEGSDRVAMVPELRAGQAREFGHGWLLGHIRRQLGDEVHDLLPGPQMLEQFEEAMGSERGKRRA